MGTSVFVEKTLLLLFFFYLNFNSGTPGLAYEGGGLSFPYISKSSTLICLVVGLARKCWSVVKKHCVHCHWCAVTNGSTA
uniref:Putative secreted protein n=1 Tax=Amblyomma triste TaxID=251400 RepID=A0A023G3D5_AMBTT